jgi:GNAT superfamily N-acetyltransferase
MADSSVRPARQTDAEALADLQIAAWRTGYAGILPAAALDALPGRRDGFVAGWGEATVRPPTYRHRVLVACEASSVVAGAWLGPAEDDDADPRADAEILTFVVDPDHRRSGHGSRLLAASVDFLRGAGFTAATVWLDASDGASRGLFTAAGWAPDGSTRSLDLEGDGVVVVEQHRLHTDLVEGSAA